MLLGRAGFTFGKKLPASSVTPGVVYLRDNVVHDFRDGGTALASTLSFSGSAFGSTGVNAVVSSVTGVSMAGSLRVSTFWAFSATRM